MANTTKPITVRNLLHSIYKLIGEKEITYDTPLIYASDDEGNSYQAVITTWSLMQTKNPISYWERISHEDIADEWWHTVLCVN
jgi:hypothetical protein